MNKIKFPEQIKTSYIKNQLQYKGFYHPKQFNRLAKSFNTIKNDIKYILNIFRIKDFNFDILKIKSNLGVFFICKNCNKPFVYLVNIKNNIVPVNHIDQVKYIPNEYGNIFINKKKTINILKIIKNEMILNLPIIPIHKNKKCNLLINTILNQNLKIKKINPFSMLSKLKEI